MPGAPIKRRLSHWIEQEHGAEWLELQVSEGRSLRSIAKELEVSAGFLCTVIGRNTDLAERISRARERGADALVEDALELVDSANPIDVQVRKLQSDMRKWIASKWAPKRYGEQAAVPAVNVNLNVLHLEALRALKATPRPQDNPAETKQLEPISTGELT